MDAVMLKLIIMSSVGFDSVLRIPTGQWSCRLPSRRHSSMVSPNPPARRNR